jgi:chromosome segregation ATPase
VTKKPKPAARKQELKVFRTPIGFHDAYVAAPSRKAALEAWGADSNLFAQGIAEEVTEPKLTEEPLARPGEVIKKARGSAEEHLAAADAIPRRKPKQADESGSAPPKKAAEPKPKPSRAELDAAEEALEKAEKKQRKTVRKLDERIQQLERERRELQRSQEAERDKLAEKRDRVRAAYEQAMEAWRS